MIPSVAASRRRGPKVSIASSGAVNTGSGSGTVLTVTAPAGSPNDLLVLFVGTRGNNTHTIDHADLTQVIQIQRGSNAGNLRVLTKTAGVSDAVSFKVNWSSSSNGTQCLAVLRVSGALLSAPVPEATGTNKTGTTSSSHIAPALVSPASSRSLVIRALLMATAGSGPPTATMVWDAPATEVVYTGTAVPSSSSLGNGALSIAVEPVPSGGAIPERGVTSNTAQASAAVTFTIAPAA